MKLYAVVLTAIVLVLGGCTDDAGPSAGSAAQVVGAQQTPLFRNLGKRGEAGF